MKKGFWSWHRFKIEIENITEPNFFHEKEVWYTAVGINVGVEEDGKGTEFRRPVMILKKFNKNMFLGLPLSRTNRKGAYHFKFEFLKGIQSTAILSQIRLFDSKRLILRIGLTEKEIFIKIQRKIREVLFSDSSV